MSRSGLCGSFAYLSVGFGRTKGRRECGAQGIGSRAGDAGRAEAAPCRRADRGGQDREEIAAELEVSSATLYHWCRQYGGMDTDAASRTCSPR
ncbi:transposase [Nocardia xishanensis]|uniref:transposase n=1 Tax=Nocardia xishanensis TaxID=238964 RepID=UPI0033F6D542